MDFRYVAPVLPKLDGLTAEVACSSLREAEWPLLGLAGLVVWRLGGRLSHLANRGFLPGAQGEVVMMPQCSATVADGVPCELVEGAARTEIDRLCSRGVTDADVTRARRQLIARLVFDVDSVTNIAHQLGYFEILDAGGVLAALPTKVNQVTAADVTAALRQYLDPAKVTVGLFHPRPTP